MLSITNQDLIRDALVLSGILGSTQTVSALQGKDALQALNEMMSEWEDGILRELGWYYQDDLTAVTPVPDWAIRGVKGSLARALSASKNLPVTESVLSLQQAGMGAIRKRTVSRRPVSLVYAPQGEAKLQRRRGAL